jgi:hypothetical protein
VDDNGDGQQDLWREKIMKVIQITIDESLLAEVDRVV